MEIKRQYTMEKKLGKGTFQFPRDQDQQKNLKHYWILDDAVSVMDQESRIIFKSNMDWIEWIISSVLVTNKTPTAAERKTNMKNYNCNRSFSGSFLSSINIEKEKEKEFKKEEEDDIFYDVDDLIFNEQQYYIRPISSPIPILNNEQKENDMEKEKTEKTEKIGEKREKTEEKNSSPFPSSFSNPTSRNVGKNGFLFFSY